MLKRVQGIVLRTTNYGETHVIVTIFSREGGKTALMARGAKKPKSPFGAAVQPFVESIFVFYQGRGMGSLNQADIIQSHRRLREDIFLNARGSCMLELLDKLTEDQQASPALYDLITFALGRMHEGEDGEALQLLFETKMLAVSGADPVLHACVSCGDAEGEKTLSIRDGGALCLSCASERENEFFPRPKTIKVMRLFQQAQPERLGSITLHQETKKELQIILDEYYQNYVGVTLRAKRFLQQLDNMEPPGS
ncbi:DNA repair protein RecO [Alkalicoccus chagannorensis]|uniref:DNA repair protein RecO n=1 Tax=Alkalicoccus chagannorensis TaxID=427072 RepID=UPI0003F66C62|nr:DNA repair protein RecO [Alkalicoccus chagannorensis]